MIHDGLVKYLYQECPNLRHFQDGVFKDHFVKFDSKH